MRIIYLIICITVFSSINSFSQNNQVGKKYVYEFRDGTTIIGIFIRQESGNIYIINEEGGKETYIPEVMIANIFEADASNIVEGEYWFPNLHDSRYFFAPSAFGLEEGEGYYSTSYWILWQVQYGISDNFSIGGGTTPFGSPIMLNFKLTANLAEKSNIAYGWLYGYERIEIGTLLNMPFVVYTYGTKENNFTIGTGLSFSALGESALGSEDVVLNIATVQRISRRFAFVFETFVLNAFSGSDVNFLGGPGLRYFRKINRITTRNGAGASTWDIQFISPAGMGAEGWPMFLPMVGKSWKF